MPPAPREIEIKLRVADVRAIRRRLRALGARPGPRLHEANVLFDTPDQSLRRRDMLLRVRVEGPTRRGAASPTREARIALLDSWLFPARRPQPAIVTFKAPPAPDAGEPGAPYGSQAKYKVRREIEFEVSDAHRLRSVLEALGFRPAFYYEKLRSSCRARRFPHLLLSLDETPAGIFLELEGPPAAIDRARQALGFRPEDAILVSYGALYAAHRAASGLPMTDMLFV